MSDHQRLEDENVMFTIDNDTARHFLAAHLIAASARRCIDSISDDKCRQDPDDLLHLARLYAAEAQHEMGLAVETAQQHNSPSRVTNALAPLMNALELSLDAIRYRAHTPFSDQPWWGYDLICTPDKFAEIIDDLVNELPWSKLDTPDDPSAS